MEKNALPWDFHCQQIPLEGAFYRNTTCLPGYGGVQNSIQYTVGVHYMLFDKLIYKSIQ